MSRAVEASRGRAIEAQRGQAVLTLVRVAALLAMVGMMLGAALAWMTTGVADRQLAQGWARREVNQHLNPAATLQAVPEPTPDPEHDAAIRLLRRALAAGIAIAIPLAAGGTMLLLRQWVRTARDAARDEVLRGNRIATAQELASLLAWARKHGRPITFGGVPLPPQDEARHLLAVGKSGSGKTTALRSLVRQIAERGEHALIFDPDGSYVAQFYRPGRGDVILNIWDERSARWNPLADIVDKADAERVSAVLLPKPQGLSEGAIWYDQARAVLAEVIHHLVQAGRTEAGDLAAMLTGASVDELRKIVAGTPAARAFEPGADKATASVLFMLTSASRIVAMLASLPSDAAPFSFDRFYAGLDAHSGPKPFVFLAAPRRFREAGAPIVAAWIDAAAAAILQRQPDQAPQAWLLLDEVASLPPIQSLMTLLPEGRKYAACIVLACQSIAQLRQAYTDQGAEVVTGQCATQIIMATGDSATAKWAVELAGTVETQALRPTETLGSDQDGRGSLATTRERKTLVLDAELAGLAIGEAFLRLSGYPLARIRIDPPEAEPVLAPAFIPRPVASPPAPRDAEPGQARAIRIEDRDDWLTTGGLA